MIARIIDFFDYLFNYNVIKEEKEEDKQYNNLLIEKNDLINDLGLMTKSRDRYLENCKKKTEKIKELKEENKQLKEKIKELKNGKGSV